VAPIMFKLSAIEFELKTGNLFYKNYVCFTPIQKFDIHLNHLRIVMERFAGQVS
jgi:hypothetical protein